MYILGIETSCDNTAVSLIYKNKIIYNYNIDQNAMLILLGGYVPHMLSEKHSWNLEKIQDHVIGNINKVEYIAVTTGPGILLSLNVGYRFATFLSKKFNKKIFFVDHIEAHALSYSFEQDICPPYCSLILSGGHTILMNIKEIGQIEIISRTIDDAVGEVFDKLARYLKINPQNGAGIEKKAKAGKLIPELINFQVDIKKNKNYFSFSGIKARFIAHIKRNKYTIEDICFNFQLFVSKYILKQILNNYEKSKLPKTIALCGGVANNNYIYNYLKTHLHEHDIELVRTSPTISCDNAIMIAWVCYLYVVNKKSYTNSIKCYSETPYSNFQF